MARPYKFKCQVCGGIFEAVRQDARQCSPACRQRSYRERQTANMRRRSLAADLLRRQTRAIIHAADPAVLESIAREAELLLGQRV